MSSPADPAAVIRRFASLLDRLRPGPNEVFDVGALDDPPEVIEAALAEAVAGDVEHTLAPSQIQGCLAALAQFQPDLGTPILDPPSEVARRMTDTRARGETLDAVAIARAVDEQARSERWFARRAAAGAKVERDRARLLGHLPTY